MIEFHHLLQMFSVNFPTMLKSIFKQSQSTWWVLVVFTCFLIFSCRLELCIRKYENKLSPIPKQIVKILFIEGQNKVDERMLLPRSVSEINSYISSFVNRSLTFHDAFNVFMSYCLDKMSHAKPDPLADWKWTSASHRFDQFWLNKYDTFEPWASLWANPLMELRQQDANTHCLSVSVCAVCKRQPRIQSKIRTEIHLSKRSKREEMKLCGSEQVLRRSINVMNANNVQSDRFFWRIWT